MVQVVITSRSPLVKDPLRRSSCNLLLNHLIITSLSPVSPFASDRLCIPRLVYKKITVYTMADSSMYSGTLKMLALETAVFSHPEPDSA